MDVFSYWSAAKIVQYCYQGVQRIMVLLVNVFVFLIFVRFVAAIFNLMHDVEALFSLPYLLKHLDFFSFEI